MTTWGTSKSLYAKFEVGQNSRDLLAKFEVGQGSQNLFAAAIIKSLDISELFARFEVVHSEELFGRVIIRQTDTEELFSKGTIRQSDLVELQAQVTIMHWVVLYCKFEVGQGAANLLGKIKIRQPASTELYAHVVIQDTAELYAHAVVRHVGSNELPATFEVGQNSRDLLAKFEVGQNSADLFGKANIRQASSVEILCKFSIPVSVDLFAKFRIRQETLDLFAKFLVTRQGAVQDLPASFSVGQNSENLWGSMIVQQSVQLNLYGSLVVRHPDTVELYSHVIIRQAASAEAYAHLITRNTGAQDLLCRFHIGDVRDLYAHFRIGLKDSVVVIAIDNLTSFLTYVEGIGEGFISEAQVEDDGSEKMMGLNSFKITSNYEAGGYKEIKFGWMGGFLLPAPAYANIVGEVWMLDVGGYLTMVGQIGLYVDDPEGWGGAYFNR